MVAVQPVNFLAARRIRKPQDIRERSKLTPLFLSKEPELSNQIRELRQVSVWQKWTAEVAE